MKNRSLIFSKNNGFKGQFNDLNNSEMLNLRGGDTPPPPPPPVGDFPLVTQSSTNYMPPQQLPVL